jgi:hypothetical protein
MGSTDNGLMLVSTQRITNWQLYSPASPFKIPGLIKHFLRYNGRWLEISG